MSEKEALQKYLDIQKETTRRKLRIVSPDELFQGQLYHISPVKRIARFIPSISQRQGSAEDRTIPRVCVSDHLVGALLGYAAAVHDFIGTPINTGSGADGFYAGGYYIHVFKDEYSLEPSSELVYDVKESHERWLVPYSSSKNEYVSTAAGKFFLSQVSFMSPYKGTRDQELVCSGYLETPLAIQVTPTKVLEPGFYHIENLRPERDKTIQSTRKNTRNVEIVQISKDDYESAKRPHVSMLSHSLSLSHRWFSGDPL